MILLSHFQFFILLILHISSVGIYYQYQLWNVSRIVLISYCYYNVLSQTLWIKTTQNYYLIDLEVKSPHWLSLGWNQGVNKTDSFWRFLGRSVSWSFLVFRGHRHSLALGPSSVFRTNRVASSLLFDLCFHTYIFSLPLTFLLPSYKDFCD